ncbi:MAG: prepilin-type N-terminal cleavage/methylation domain-containing protein [Gemmatimonadota bacterium]
MRGSTLIEIIVAITILSVGVLGLVGTGVAVNRLLGRGHWATVAAAEAEARLEILKAQAGDSAGCANLAGGSASVSAGLTTRWGVTGGGSSHTVTVEVTGGGLRADTILTVIGCP